MYLSRELSIAAMLRVRTWLKPQGHRGGGGTHLVGLITSAPISFFASFRSLRISFSNMGITKARVFPEPVTASTTTSLWRMKRGIVEAWTGVIWVWPIE